MSRFTKEKLKEHVESSSKQAWKSYPTFYNHCALSKVRLRGGGRVISPSRLRLIRAKQLDEGHDTILYWFITLLDIPAKVLNTWFAAFP